MSKFAKLYLIGRVSEEEDDSVKPVDRRQALKYMPEPSNDQPSFERRKQLKKDFEELRKVAIDMV